MKPKVIIVNAPKGGVGKTTTAVNLSILLAENGYRIVGYDIAQGELFSKRIYNYKDYDIKMFTNELSEDICKAMDLYIRKNDVDYIVVDTDDYFEVTFEFFNKFADISKETIIMIPFPNGYEERERIPGDIRKIVLGSLIHRKEKKIIIFCNKMSRLAKSINKDVFNSLKDEGIEHLLVNEIISTGESIYAPYFIKDNLYRKQLQNLMEEHIK